MEEQNPPPPPATGKDTTVSVTALLNNDTFKALGRADVSSGKLSITFSDLNSTASLKFELDADTPGVYHMDRTISAHTALWYDKDGKSFTSRATEEAGGTVTITEVDSVKHRIKGTFDLLLLSRTDSARYQFDEGKFDILYNHFVITMGDKVINLQPDEGAKTVALTSGNESVPQPTVFIQLNDSLAFNITILRYTGTGNYDATDKDKVSFQVLYTKKEKVLSARSGTVSLIRYNYGQFLQVLFEGTLQAEDGEQLVISNGSAVIGL